MKIRTGTYNYCFRHFAPNFTPKRFGTRPGATFVTKKFNFKGVENPYLYAIIARPLVSAKNYFYVKPNPIKQFSDF
jgi:hypothetical protein